MSYQSKALATPGLLALWMLNDAAGSTTAADVGPNNLPLTYSAAKISGDEIILGGGNGMSGSLYAQRAVASGSTLAPTAAITLCGWFTASSWLTTGAATIMGRNNHFRVICRALGAFAGNGWLPTALEIGIAQNWTATTKAYFVTLTYNGSLMQLYINGSLMRELIIAGALPSNAEPFLVNSSVSSQMFSGTIAGVGMWNRALTAGEIWELFSEGTKVTPVTSILNVNNIYDSNPAVAAAAQSTRCPVCHGQRRANEATISQSGLDYHPGCYAVSAGGRPTVVPTTSTPWAEYEGPIIRLITQMLYQQSELVTDVTKPTSFNGSRMLPTSTGLTANYDIYGPWAMTAGLIAGRRGVPKEHWSIQLAISQVERIWSLQDATTGNIVETSGGSGGSDFILPQLGETILALKHHISDSTMNRWRANYQKLGMYPVNYPQGKQEKYFYVNGNREAGEFWANWMLYAVTDDPFWLTEYEHQYNFTVDPTNNTPYSGNVGGVDSAGNGTFGWVQVVAPTFADGRDGKGYLIERTSAHLGSIVGVDGPGVLDGYCPNYVHLSTVFMMRTWLLNNDIRLLKMINMSFNLLKDRTNLTSATVGDVPAWTLDGRNGSRQNNFSSFGSPLLPFLKFRAGRTDITDAQIVGAWGEEIRAWTGDFMNQNAISRAVNTDLGTWLATLP